MTTSNGDPFYSDACDCDACENTRLRRQLRGERRWTMILAALLIINALVMLLG